MGGGYRVGVRKDGCHLVLPVKTGIHGGVTAVGTALTSSGFVVEGVPTRAPPWIPHRGAVRRGRGGYRIGVRYDGWGGCDGGGDRPYVERVRSRRGPHPGPTMDTASGCGKTREGWVPAWGAERRLPPRLTGENRYPWWCDGGGDRPYVERVRSRRGPHPGPTVDTASGCGKTVGGRKDGWGWVGDDGYGGRRYPWWCGSEGTAPTSRGFVAEGVPTRALPWIPHRGAVRRLGGGYRLGGGKTAATSSYR